jgi:hypothetical protein
MPVVLEHNVKHGVALGMLNECFNLVKDQRTRIDMLHQAECILDINLNGYATKGRDHFSSFMRIHDIKVLEVPFASTLPSYYK